MTKRDGHFNMVGLELKLEYFPSMYENCDCFKFYELTLT